MLSSSSTIRRFTPPTCTLEIKAKQSPFDRWTTQEALKNLRFKLSFDDPRVLKEQQVTIKGDRQQLEQLYTAAISYTQNFLNSSFQDNKIEPISTTTKPYFQPTGLVSHQLFLGALADKNSVARIELSALQLFDLVAALEDCYSQIAAASKLTPPQQKKAIPFWGSIAALALLTVGLTAGGIKLLQLSSTKNDTVATEEKSDSPSAIPQLNEVVPPKVSSAKQQPTPQPQLTEPLSSREKLPPPPAVDLPKPQPDIPDPAKYSLPEVAKKSGFPLPQEIPADKELAQTKSTIDVPIQPVDIPPQPVESADLSDMDAQTATLPSFAPSSTALKPEDFVAAKIDPNLATKKDRNLTQLEDLERSPNSPSETDATSSLEDQSGLDKLDKQDNVALNSRTTQTPQLQEVTQYFQQKWQPPEKLSQSLEYRLWLNPDGSIQRIVPLGKVSEIYLDRTSVPLRGEQFISPLPDGKKITVRLLLSPDGEVMAFAE